ncbi:hypothetical protein, partial [Mycobacterium malmoense]|uniref:hypothetical protein n=1 Tax=Mycobacterium malmoense TaxID=1780 RepID=UPI001C42EA21
SWKVSTPSIRRERHGERRPRPFIASTAASQRDRVCQLVDLLPGVENELASLLHQPPQHYPCL